MKIKIDKITRDSENNDNDMKMKVKMHDENSRMMKMRIL